MNRTVNALYRARLTRDGVPLTVQDEPTTVTVVSRELKPGRSGGRIVAGEAPEAVAETVRLLAEEAKVL